MQHKVQKLYIALIPRIPDQGHILMHTCGVSNHAIPLSPKIFTFILWAKDSLSAAVTHQNTKHLFSEQMQDGQFTTAPSPVSIFRHLVDLACIKMTRELFSS